MQLRNGKLEIGVDKLACCFAAALGLVEGFLFLGVGMFGVCCSVGGPGPAAALLRGELDRAIGR
jgi:hypothetical protein